MKRGTLSLSASSPTQPLPPPAPEAATDTPFITGDLPPWSPVECELGVSGDVVTFVGRDLRTGRPRIKIELARVDASPEWSDLILQWLTERAHGGLRLLSEDVS